MQFRSITSILSPDLDSEYDDELAEAEMTFEDVCSLPSRAPLTILRDHDLVPFGSPSYLYERCSS